MYWIIYITQTVYNIIQYYYYTLHDTILATKRKYTIHIRAGLGGRRKNAKTYNDRVGFRLAFRPPPPHRAKVSAVVSVYKRTRVAKVRRRKTDNRSHTLHIHPLTHTHTQTDRIITPITSHTRRQAGRQTDSYKEITIQSTFGNSEFVGVREKIRVIQKCRYTSENRLNI